MNQRSQLQKSHVSVQEASLGTIVENMIAKREADLIAKNEVLSNQVASLTALVSQLNERLAKVADIEDYFNPEKSIGRRSIKILDDELIRWINAACKKWNMNLDAFVTANLQKLKDNNAFIRPITKHDNHPAG